MLVDLSIVIFVRASELFVSVHHLVNEIYHVAFVYLVVEIRHPVIVIYLVL